MATELLQRGGYTPPWCCPLLRHLFCTCVLGLLPWWGLLQQEGYTPSDKISLLLLPRLGEPFNKENKTTPGDMAHPCSLPVEVHG